MSRALRRGGSGGRAAGGGGGHQRVDQLGVCSREPQDPGESELGVSSLSLRVVTSWLCIRQFAKPSCEFCRIGRQEQPSQLNTCVTCPHPLQFRPSPSQLGGISTRLRMFGLGSLPSPPLTYFPKRLLSKRPANAESHQSCGNCMETDFVANENQILL